MRPLLTILFLVSFVTAARGQSDSVQQKSDTLSGKLFILQKVKRDGVTLPEVEIKEVDVMAPAATTKARKSDFRKYDRLVYNIKKVYPYARIVRKRLQKVNEEIMNITDEKERKRYLKGVEKQVFAEYEGDIKQLTISQGKILIKLIDRETRNTSFDLIREYRGKISAAFWQGIARIFGTNLKEEYDPYGDDILIEVIINEIDAGTL